MSNAPAAPTSALNLFSLKGRRALVTGGHMGLGITMARALAQAGADVALASRTLDACQRAAADLSAATGCTAKAFTVDVASAASVRSSYTARTSRARSLMTSSATFNPVG